MNEWIKMTQECINEWIDENEMMNEKEWLNGLVNEWMKMKWWMNELMNENEWMNNWMKECK